MTKFNEQELNGIQEFLLSCDRNVYDFWVEENTMDEELNILVESKEDENDYFFHMASYDLSLADELEEIVKEYVGESGIVSRNVLIWKIKTTEKASKSTYKNKKMEW